MTYGFQRTATGRVVLRVDQVERGLLMSVARQVMDLVQPAEASPDQDPLAAQLGWVDGDVGISDDPAVARLLPDAYDDPDDAREFRRFTENDLRQSKMQHAMTVVEEIERSGEKVAVTSTDSWLGLLFHVYDWLTFLQESLVRCMDPALYGFSDGDVPVAEEE